MKRIFFMMSGLHDWRIKWNAMIATCREPLQSVLGICLRLAPLKLRNRIYSFLACRGREIGKHGAGAGAMGFRSAVRIGVWILRIPLSGWSPQLRLLKQLVDIIQRPFPRQRTATISGTVSGAISSLFWAARSFKGQEVSQGIGAGEFLRLGEGEFPRIPYDGANVASYDRKVPGGSALHATDVPVPQPC